MQQLSVENKTLVKRIVNPDSLDEYKYAPATLDQGKAFLLKLRLE